MTEKTFTPQKNASALLAHLLMGANLIEPSDLKEATKAAKRLDVSLDKALTLLKCISEINLKTARQAESMVSRSKISPEIAVKALRIAKQNGISFEDAIDVTGSIVSKSQPMQAAGNPLTELLLTSEMIAQEQLTRAMQQAQEAQTPIGRTLIVNRLISRWVLNEALLAQGLVKDSKISRNQAEQALRAAVSRHISIFQVLFESGAYNECSGDTLKLFELIAMAQILPESDFLDCLEICLSQDKPFGQVILEQNLMTVFLLESACSLLDMVGSYLKPFQATEALKQVRARNVPVYQALAELQPPPQVEQRQLRIGDLIVESGLTSRERLETAIVNREDPPVRIGKALMNAGLITEACLYKALRCQSLYREGMLSADQTVAVMSACKDDQINIEEALVKNTLTVPARMHWSWM